MRVSLTVADEVEFRNKIPCRQCPSPLRDALVIMERIQEAKAGFRSLTEAIDTTTAQGRMMMQMVGAFADALDFNCGVEETYVFFPSLAGRA